MAVNIAKLKSMSPPKGMDFHISKVGHVVLQCRDLEVSTAFYTQVLGFKVSDVYPEEMMPGGMVFLRCNTDHHCLALVGAGDGKNANRELHHLAFEVATLARPRRENRFRRAPPCRLPDRRGVSRSRQSLAGNLLGRRSGRQRRPGASIQRVARRQIAGRSDSQPRSGPGHAYPLLVSHLRNSMNNSMFHRRDSRAPGNPAVLRSPGFRLASAIADLAGMTFEVLRKLD